MLTISHFWIPCFIRWYWEVLPHAIHSKCWYSRDAIRFPACASFGGFWLSPEVWGSLSCYSNKWGFDWKMSVRWRRRHLIRHPDLRSPLGSYLYSSVTRACPADYNILRYCDDSNLDNFFFSGSDGFSIVVYCWVASLIGECMLFHHDTY